MKRRLEINGVIIVLASALVAFFPQVFFRSRINFYYDLLLKLLGISCILLGQIFRVSARGYKAEYSRQGQQLIQGGPYALVRNPMYLGILLIGLGVVLVLFKWWGVFIFLSVFTLRYILLIFAEEKKLLKLFPEEYPLYLQQTPRLIPSAPALLKKNIRDYLPLKAYWLKKELGTMLAVLLSTLTLEAYLAIRSEGLKAYFKEAACIAALVLLFACFIGYLGRKNG